MGSWSVEDERYISAALAIARDELAEMRKNLPRKEPLGHEVVFSVLQKKVEIELREHARDAVPGSEYCAAKRMKVWHGSCPIVIASLISRWR